MKTKGRRGSTRIEGADAENRIGPPGWEILTSRTKMTDGNRVGFRDTRDRIKSGPLSEKRIQRWYLMKDSPFKNAAKSAKGK